MDRLRTLLSKKALSAVFGFMILAVVIGGSYSLGYRSGVSVPREIMVGGAANIDDPDAPADFLVFWEAWDKLRQYHLKGSEITNEELLFGAIDGIAGAFGDPNTAFLAPKVAQKFEEDIQGNFGGIGAEIGLKEEQLIIVAPLKDSPASRAGLASGDQILAIDDFDTDRITVEDAVTRIRGPIGTKVILKILRESWGGSREVPLVRDTIVIPTADHELLPGGVLNVKLYNFNGNAAFGFHQAVIDGFFGGAKGMVLDLRNNPGGFLEIAVSIAGWFLDRGDVVTTEQFATGEGRVFRANGNEALLNMPVVVLVNGGSASASEILAGALKDHRGVTLVGTKTFGKGTVQELHTLESWKGESDASKPTLKITIAQWLTPSGAEIDGKGITPDVEVELTEEDAEAGRDPQLEKAIEILKKEIAERE